MNYSMKKENGKYHKNFHCAELNNCSDGDRIFDMFLLTDIRYCSNERGVKWLNVRLEDKTGTIYAKIWSENIKMEYEGMRGQIVYVSGNVSFYGGRPDFSIEQMKAADEDAIEISEIIKVLPDIRRDQCKKQIKVLLSNITSETLKKFAEYFLNDNALEEMAVFPVRTSGHHCYRGGLMEHICEVTTASYYYAKTTSPLREIPYNMDLVIAGALLHDMGSLICFQKDGYTFFVNDEDRLLGTGYMVNKALGEAKEKTGLDDATFGHLLHIIEATHGNVSPVTMEAMLLRSQNKLSAELETYEKVCMTAEEVKGPEGFIYSRELKREIWRKSNE